MIICKRFASSKCFNLSESFKKKPTRKLFAYITIFLFLKSTSPDLGTAPENLYDRRIRSLLLEQILQNYASAAKTAGVEILAIQVEL